MPPFFAFLFHCKLFLYSFILKFFILLFLFSTRDHFHFYIPFLLQNSFLSFSFCSLSLVTFFLPAFSAFYLYFPFHFLPYFSFTR